MSKALVWRNGLQHVLATLGQRRGASLPRLDFEHPHSSPGMLGAALLGAGLLACAAVAVRFEVLGRQQADLDSAASALSAEIPARPGRGTRTIAGGTLSKATAQRAEQANAIIVRLSMPWDAWFRQLESAANGKVVLTVLQPEAEGRRVRLSGESRSFDDLIDYMMRLEATPGFAHVFLSEHAESAAGSGHVSFTLTADWMGAS